MSRNQNNDNKEEGEKTADSQMDPDRYSGSIISLAVCNAFQKANGHEEEASEQSTTGR